MIARERLIALLFVLPAVLLIGLFLFWPTVSMARTSLHRQRLTDVQTGPFCGGENFRAVWEDPDFHAAARNTAFFAVLVVPLQTALALALAVWVNAPGRWTRGLRLAVFLPTTLSLTVVAVLWDLLYEPSQASGSGLFNGLLGALGLPGQPFLTSPAQAMPCLAAMSIWQGVGFQMMILLAGLQSVSGELYEAAALDGARRWGRFIHVTLPGIAPTLTLVLMITTIFALKLFVQPYLMTGGGPQGATRSVVQYMFEAAFSRRDLGLACAAGVLFFLAVAVVAGVQRRLFRSAEALT